VRRIISDGTCTRCRDDFVETTVGCSKSACKFIDEVETHLGIKLQHKHFDPELLVWTGSEHNIKSWPHKSVDGFNKKENLVIEFLGDDIHGYPPKFQNDPDAVDRYGFSLEGRYGDTSEKMGKLKALGYRVLYVWQSDVNRRTGKSRLPGVFREFHEHLEWE
jgi:hypothetical protein